MQRRFIACLLWPISLLFSLLAAVRRRWLRSVRLSVPVIVVGGVTVGGAGKTPLTLWLVEALRQRGYVPGIISRGYGGRVSGVAEVTPTSEPAQVGDEPVLLRQRAGVPVYVGADRVLAGQALLAAHPEVNLLLCDDGLQHYRLARDVELVVLDRRGLGNGWCLPAGPLRERPARLKQIDALILNEGVIPAAAPAAIFDMQLRGERFYRLDQPDVSVLPTELPQSGLHAIAGIGEPQRFFDLLAGLNLSVTTHAFPDHYAYLEADLPQDANAILTTEKDAVKLRAIRFNRCPIWVLPVTATISKNVGRSHLKNSGQDDRRVHDGAKNAPLPTAQLELDQLIVEKLNGRAPA